jgi:hypothetical protein
MLWLLFDCKAIFEQDKRLFNKAEDNCYRLVSSEILPHRISKMSDAQRRCRIR